MVAAMTVRGRKPRRWTPEQDQQLRELWATDDSSKVIALHMGISPEMVRARAAWLELPKRRPARPQSTHYGLQERKPLPMPEYHPAPGWPTMAQLRAGR